MTDSELLIKVKKAKNITGTYQDDSLMEYIEEVRRYMYDAGVPFGVINSTESVGVITRGVSDLWESNGSGQAKLSEYFMQRVIQLANKDSSDVITPIPIPVLEEILI